MNYVFGSGVVGMVAHRVLAGNWAVIPFGRSRFFSFNPPLCDNFLVRDKALDQLVADLGGVIAPLFYRRGYSLQGELLKEHDEAACTLWLSKIFGDNIPGQSVPYWRSRLASPIYDLRVSYLYRSLQQKHHEMLKAEAAKGPVTEVGDHYFIRGGERCDFESLVSTIPLSSLLGLMSKNGVKYESLPVHYVDVKSTSINLEGLNQALVADHSLEFFKVVNVAPQRYVFYSVRELQQPGAYLLPVIGQAEVIDGTSIRDVIPVGERPDLTSLEQAGIFCVGSCAQHDWCADVSSNFLRLLRYAERGHRAAT